MKPNCCSEGVVMGAYLSKNEGIQSSFFDGLCTASKQSASHQGTGFLITNTSGLEIIAWNFDQSAFL
ncbi:unnamed protein product [Parnassius mnemosyne]|uniref:Uncharacterized protein n=1 Tax=Parnassius mnemosyne TaxID=213953 RepID=A0AAV1KY96_9NEOP